MLSFLSCNFIENVSIAKQLLEVFRTRIDEEYGLGSFVKWSPWKEMQFIAPISK